MKLKKFNEYIKEESDYRNVTGFGSGGSNDPQNAGPSFNKGPMSAIYNQPSVIGTETVEIEDPYFGVSSNMKRKRVKKNKKIERYRKTMSQYLDDQDKRTQNKLDSQLQNETILWYSNGKFEQGNDDDINDNNIQNSTFKLGDEVTLIDHSSQSYFYDKVLKLMVISLNTLSDKYHNLQRVFIIEDIIFVENLDGYTGDMLFFERFPPSYYFKSEDFQKINQ